MPDLPRPDINRHTHQLIFAAQSAFSYPQFLKILFDGRGQGDGLGVEVFQLDMDLAQGFLEVEVFIHFLGGDADVAAGGEAPVVGFDLLQVHQFDQAFHVAQFGFGEAFGEPVGLFPEVAHLFELFDSQPARFVGGLAGAGDVAADPGVAALWRCTRFRRCR